MTDNKRYIGDVFIDGKTDILLREFLTNLFNQYNGEGKGFNADMLDGHHYSDIQFELNYLNDTKLSEITIGKSTFNADSVNQYLLFGDVIYEGDSFTWKNNIPPLYTITDALEGLYEYLIDERIEPLEENKVDKEKVNPNDMSENPRMKVLSDNNYTDEDKQTLDDMSDIFFSQLTDYVDENGVTHHFFDAQLINGLRLILITQQDYDELPNDFKKYWRNIFIIKEPDEIPTDLDYHSPLEFDLKDGYDFRVAQDDALVSEYIMEDDGSGRDYWIQLKHKWASQWTNLLPLQNFLYGVDLKGEIISVIENEEGVQYNQVAMAQLLNALLNDKTNSHYVGLSYLPSDYKDDFVHQILKNGTALTGTNASGFTNVDIGHAFDSEFTGIDNKINSITNSNQTGTLDVQINALNTALTGLDQQINGTDATAILKQLQSINSSVSQIQSDVASMKSVTDNIGKWKKYYIPDLDSVGGNTTTNTINYYNETLHLAMLKPGFMHHFKAVDNDWYLPIKNDKGTYYPNVVCKAVPVQTITMINYQHPFNTVLKIDNYGRIWVRSEKDIDSSQWFGGSILYRYDRLYTDSELEQIRTRSKAKNFNIDADSYSRGRDGDWWNDTF